MSSTRSRRRISALLCASLTLVALTAAACSPQEAPAPTPGTITVIVGAAGANLNPYTNVLSSRQVGSLLFRGMFGVDAEGMPVPDLVTEVPTVDNGGMSEDRRVITYKLDPDAQWADGTPLTADDVIFTWELIASGALTDDPRGCDNVTDVTAVDEETVQLTLIEPDAPFAWRFVPYVLPQHLLADSEDILSDDFWYGSVGSRGLTVTRYLKATQADLTDPSGVIPGIRVVFTDSDDSARTVWEDQDHAVWLDPPLGPTGAEQYDVVPTSRWQAFVMNTAPGHPTADLAVREAFSAATTVTVTPGSVGPYGVPLSEWTLDDQTVASDLTKAGWRLGADGVRTKAGQELAYDVIFNPIDAQEGDRVEGIPVADRFGGSIEIYPSYAYTDYFGASPLVLGEFDVALTEFPIGVPFGWAWPFDSSDVPSEANPAGLNVARIADPALDEAYRSMKAAGSPDELGVALASAWDRLEQQRYVLWDAQLEQTMLYKGVEGVAAQPIEEYALRFADDWRLPEAGRLD